MRAPGSAPDGSAFLSSLGVPPEVEVSDHSFLFFFFFVVNAQPATRPLGIVRWNQRHLPSRTEKEKLFLQKLHRRARRRVHGEHCTWRYASKVLLRVGGTSPPVHSDRWRAPNTYCNDLDYSVEKCRLSFFSTLTQSTWRHKYQFM